MQDGFTMHAKSVSDVAVGRASLCWLVGQDGGGQRTSLRALRECIGSTHPTESGGGGHSTRTAATGGDVRGQGPREGQGGRSPRSPWPRRKHTDLERDKGCASAHAGVGRPRQGEGADHAHQAPSHARCRHQFIH
eukprot:303099-Pleurochrysis_carterae.AAC.7